ncbi:IGR protein motif-domain-containing protein [Cryomyces antarcticus]
MIVRRSLLSTAGAPPLFQAARSSPSQCVRLLHNNMPAARIPPPTPFVPDPQTFLTLIGRNMSQHAAKIPTWEALFSLTSQQLRESGVEPARSRRYLLHWREKFRNGQYGIGGDLSEVTDGVGELRVVEVPVSTGNRAATVTSSAGMKKVVVNVPAGADMPSVPLEQVKPVEQVRILGASTITGPWVEPLKGTNGQGARIVAKEGLWEQRRGHKIDGGERRKAEVRAKRRSAERKNSRA